MQRFFALFTSLFHRPRADEHDGSADDPLHRTGEMDGEEPEFVRAVNISKGVTVASRVLWAGTSAERRKGLLGRDGLSPDEGMYIVPTQWIHMFGMRFPIDVAFLGEDGKVLHIHHGLRPNRLSRIVWRAEGALELAAGLLRETNTEVGDLIQFE